MAITDLIPWKKAESDREPEESALQRREDSLPTLERQMNRLFDDFFWGSGLEPFGALREGWDAFNPRVDVVETDKEIEISAELPGLEEGDIDVKLSQNVLTIIGEKREQKKEQGHNYQLAERSYGSFTRSIPLPGDVDTNSADAVFRNGVLTIVLPRKEKAQSRKRIAVKAH
jgi:HSP20 family protein